MSAFHSGCHCIASANDAHALTLTASMSPSGARALDREPVAEPVDALRVERVDFDRFLAGESMEKPASGERYRM